jgi:pimeloyl-ACP methyl ester carboxylesterase
MTLNTKQTTNYTHYGSLDSKSIWILHGILGSRQNWGVFAKSLAKSCPTVSIYTIDLLAHGDNQTHSNDYTIQACVEDLDQLTISIGHPYMVIGHSFGGKVGLAYAEYLSQSSHALQAVWLLDSSLDAKKQVSQHEVLDTIQMCKQTPMPQDSRRTLMQSLQSQGASLGVAQWMTTNLKRTESGFIWRFYLDGIEDLINNYWQVNAWQLLATTQQTTHIHFVRAEQGMRWSQEAIERIEQLSHTYSKVNIHVLANSGHWVHVDQPQTLLEMIVTHSLR